MRLCIDKDNLTIDSLYICAAHRYKLGLGWRINEKCPHRIESNNSSLKFRINIDMASQIVKICSINCDKGDIFYQVGTKMCTNCYDDLRKTLEKFQNTFNTFSPVVERKSKLIAKENLLQKSMMIEEESMMEIDEGIISFNDSVGASHHQFDQKWDPFVLKKKWKEMTKDWKHENYLKKTIAIISNLIETQYDENASHAWNEIKAYDLNGNLKQSFKHEFEPHCEVLISSFESTNTKDTQNLILSMIPNTFSRETLLDSLNISESQVDNGRRHANKFGYGKNTIK